MLLGVTAVVGAGQTPAEPPAAPSDPPPASVSPRNASYEIDVELDHGERMLRGRQTVVWRNIREEATDELWFHLYWNAWRNDRSTWMLEDRYRERSDRRDEVRPEDWGWTEVDAIRLPGEGDGAPAVDLVPTFRWEQPDDGNPHDRTVFAVTLPAPVAPGESVEVEIEWRARVPRTFARTGYRGDYYFIAHWFPKLGVFEGDGWSCRQYHAATEYFSDYGLYDVRITLPERFVVGSTGRRIERRPNDDGTVTHHYRQADVHAFTWTASPDYVELRRRFEEPGLPPIEMLLLMQPEHLGQADRHFAAAEAAFLRYGLWYGPYPYGHVTIVDPAFESGAGGMEYPTLFTAGTRLFNPFGDGSPESVTIHEAGHQFWYGLVGNDEFESAWIDEGLDTFSTDRVYREAFGRKVYGKRYFAPPGTEVRGFFPLLFRELRHELPVSPSRLSRYRSSATSDVPADPSWRYHPETGSNISYSKTALWLWTLERHLGWERLQPVLAAFFERSRFRHPEPEELFALFDELVDEELGWFFDQVFYDDVAFDYEVQEVASFPAAPEGWVESAGELALRERPEEADEPDEIGEAGGTLYRNEVLVRRLGQGVFPVELLMVFEDGSELRRRWDGRDRWRLFVEERPVRLDRAVIDPERVLLFDARFTNNSLRREPQGDLLPAAKWASRWMIWLQDLLATFAAFT